MADTSADPQAPRQRDSHVVESGSFERVTVVPYAGLLDASRGAAEHQGGPIWPDWEQQTWPRHQRYGRVIDRLPDAPAATQRYGGTLAWGGPIVRHFGHQLADFSMRILPTLMVRPELSIAFATKPGYGPARMQDSGFVLPILDWLGVPSDRQILLTTPTSVDELFVAAQSEQLGGPGPSAETLDALDELTRRRLGAPRGAGTQLTYVSRAAQGWGFAGETYLEEALLRAGADVFRPETVPLADQLARYHTPHRLLFAEGSAIHALQLTGRLKASVTVLVRRPTFRIAESSITPRVPALDYREVARGVVHGLLASSGKPALTVGISIPDEGLLLDLLSELGVDARAHWDSAEFAQARDDDVRSWCQGQVRRHLSTDPAGIAHVVTSLHHCGLAHLTDDVSGLLARDSGLAGQRAPQSSGATPEPSRPTSASQRVGRLVQALHATHYLEIGPGDAAIASQLEAQERTVVGPRASLAVPPDASTLQLIRSTSGAFFAGLAADTVFDVIFLREPHIFEDAYRDFCAALLHTHPRSVILVDNTRPSDEYSSLRDRNAAIRAREASGSSRRDWHGDVYRMVFAVHDLHLGIDYRTIVGSGNAQTLFWRTPGSSRTPRFESLEDLLRLRYVDLVESEEMLQTASEEAALAACIEDLT